MNVEKALVPAEVGSAGTLLDLTSVPALMGCCLHLMVLSQHARISTSALMFQIYAVLASVITRSVASYAVVLTATASSRSKAQPVLMMMNANWAPVTAILLLIVLTYLVPSNAAVGTDGVVMELNARILTSVSPTMVVATRAPLVPTLTDPSCVSVILDIREMVILAWTSMSVPTTPPCVRMATVPIRPVDTNVTAMSASPSHLMEGLVSTWTNVRHSTTCVSSVAV